MTEKTTDTSKALVRTESSSGVGLPSAQEWQTMASIADVLIKSQLLPAHVKTPQAALAIMLKSRELGVPTMHGLSCIVVVQGKPTCNGELMLALVYRDHGDDAIIISETTAQRCTISYKRRSWTERQNYSFTMEDARRAGLSEGATWKKFPAAMLRARCISAVARMAFPDSIAGMYVYDEMGLQVDVEGGDQVITGVPVMPEATTTAPEPEGTRAASAPTAPASTDPAPAPSAGSDVDTEREPEPEPEPEPQPVDEHAPLRAEVVALLADDGPALALLQEKGKPLPVDQDGPTLAKTKRWLLGRKEQQRPLVLRLSERITRARSAQEVTLAVADARRGQERKELTEADYRGLHAEGEARKAELSSPLLAGTPAQVAS